MIDITKIGESNSELVADKTVVKVSTNSYLGKKGLHEKKSIIFLKRKSSGYNILEGDSKDFGAEPVIQKIINLHEVADGIYEVAVVNQQRDWETGYIEEYDYKLIQFKE